MMQRQSPSRSSSSQRRPSSISICRVMALRRGWLSTVTTATCRLCRASRISIIRAPGNVTGDSSWGPARAACQPTAPDRFAISSARAMGVWRGAGNEGDPVPGMGRSRCAAARRGREPEPQAAPGTPPGPRRRRPLRRQPDGRRHLAGEAAVPVRPGARSRRRDCQDRQRGRWLAGRAAGARGAAQRRRLCRGDRALVTAIILWNTRYLNRAIAALREVEDVPDHLLAHLSPLGWEHVNLTGDYVWSADRRMANADGYRPLRTASEADLPAA